MRTAILSLLALTLSASEGTLSAPLKRVRLYPDQAWTTREAAVSFKGPESRRVRIPGLPAGLALDNLRVQADGIPGLRIGNVSVVQESSSPARTPAWVKLDQEAEVLETRLADVRLRQQAIEQALHALEELGPERRSADETFVPNPRGSADLTRAFEVQHATLTRRGLGMEDEAKPLRKALADLRSAQSKLDAERQRVGSVVLLELVSPKEGEALIKLEIRTPQARWKPAYELRLSQDERTLELLCYATVSQASGEDWRNIGLEISNAQPSRSLGLPTPPPAVQLMYQAPDAILPGQVQGRVTDQNGAPLPGATVHLESALLKVSRTFMSDANGAFRCPLLPPGDYRVQVSKQGHQTMVSQLKVELARTLSVGFKLPFNSGATVEVVAVAAQLDATSTLAGSSSTENRFMVDGVNSLSVGRSLSGVSSLSPGVSGGIVTALEAAPTRYEESGELGRAWLLDGAREVGSDAQPRRMLLARAVLDPGLRLRAVPRASTEVYQIATAKPDPGFPWFPGAPAVVFRGALRLGQLALPRLSVGEPTAFSFGPVAGLRVQRQRLEAKVTRPKGSKLRQWTLKEQVTLVNNLEREVEVEVVEPGLRSTTDKVKVEYAQEATPATSLDRSGLMTWRMPVPPRGQARIDEGWVIQGPGSGAIPSLPAVGLPVSD